jgi:hypothetical protein
VTSICRGAASRSARRPSSTSYMTFDARMKAPT